LPRTKRIEGTSLIIVPVSKLLLDNANPRIPPTQGQKDAFKYMIRGQWRTIQPLAKSIAENGYDDFEPLLVMSADDGNYVVREGNRRLTALKMLLYPSSIPREFKKERKLIEEFSKTARDLERLKRIPCSVTDRPSSVRIMDRRHGGEKGGAGVVAWGSLPNARFRRSNGELVPELDILDEIVASGKLSEQAKEAYYVGDFTLTNFSRLVIDQKDSRKRLGISIENGKVRYVGDKETILDALATIADEVATKKINVNDIYYAEDGLRYLDKKLGEGVSLYDPDRAPSEPDVVDDVDGPRSPVDELRDEQPGEPPESTEKKKIKKARRTALISPDLVIPDFHNERKAEALFDELKRLDLDRSSTKPGFKYVASLGFRTFVELSADAYADRHGIPTYTENSKGRRRDRQLMEIITDVCKDLKKRHAEDPTLEIDDEALDRAIELNTHSNPDNILLTYELNKCVHSRGHHPSIDGMRTLWDRMEKSLVAMWRYM